MKIAELNTTPLLSDTGNTAPLLCYVCDVEIQATVYCADCGNAMCNNHNEVSEKKHYKVNNQLKVVYV